MDNSSGSDNNYLPEKVRIWIMVLTCPFAFFFSLFGYLEYQPEAGIGNALYHTFQLFILHTPHFEEPVPGLLEWGRWLAAITTALAVFNIFVYVFRSQFEYWKLLRLKDHIIICGLGDIGQALAENLMIRNLKETNSNKQHKLVIIEKNGDNENISALKKRGIRVIVGKAQDQKILRRVRIRKAIRIYAVSGDDFTNLSILKNVKEILNGNNTNKFYKFFNAVKIRFCSFINIPITSAQKIEIFANIDSLNLKTAVRFENSFCKKDCLLVKNLHEFFQTTCKIKEAGLPVNPSLTEHLTDLKERILQYAPCELPDYDEVFQEIKYFDINELSAKYIFHRFPPNRFRNIVRESDPRIHILILGFSQTGEELLKRCIQNCHFINFQNGLNKTKITLIDLQINLTRNKLKNKSPRLSDLFFLEFIEMNPHHLTHDFIEQHGLQNVDVIYIGADSDRFQESYSVRAREIFSMTIPIVRFFTKDVISDSDFTSHKKIFSIDLYSTVAKEELIRNTDTDKKAIAIHNSWLKNDIEGYVNSVEENLSLSTDVKIDYPKPTLAPWSLLNEDFRDDNRSVVEHLRVKLRTTGQLRKDEDFDKPDKIPEVDFGFLDPKSGHYNSGLIQQLAEMEHRRWMATKYYYGWRYNPERDDIKKQHPNLLRFSDLSPEIQQKDINQVSILKQIWEIGLDEKEKST